MGKKQLFCDFVDYLFLECNQSKLRHLCFEEQMNGSISHPWLSKEMWEIGQNLVIRGSGGSCACWVEIELYKSNWNSLHNPPPACLDFLTVIMIANFRQKK